jgi:Ser/Thr protein kinase RdoA (MazF antagonist)
MRGLVPDLQTGTNMSKKPNPVCIEIGDSVLKEAASKFGAASAGLLRLHDSVRVVRGDRFVEKSLCQCERDGGSFVLRLTHPRYVDVKLIAGEVDWVNYLADNGLSVPRAVPSDQGNLVEIVEDENCSYAVVCFEKAEGRQIDFDDPDEWSAGLFERYGETVGRMHALTKEYRPAGTSLVRIQWHEQDWIANRDDYLPRSESRVRQKYGELVEALHRLPRDRDAFGLIHGDAHPWNALYHEGNITLADFDFCEHSWFASEIAIILFYAVMAPTKGMDNVNFARCFLKNFMRGYRKENSLDGFWMKRIPDFLRLRMLSKYVLHYPEWKSKIMTEKRRSAFLEWKRKIQNDIPYLDLDFSKFA